MCRCSGWRNATAGVCCPHAPLRHLQLKIQPRLAFDNRYADDELARIQDTPLVIRAYWSADGLWELPPFSFSDLLKGEKGESVQLVF